MKSALVTIVVSLFVIARDATLDPERRTEYSRPDWQLSNPVEMSKDP